MICTRNLNSYTVNGFLNKFVEKTNRLFFSYKARIGYLIWLTLSTASTTMNKLVNEGNLLLQTGPICSI